MGGEVRARGWGRALGARRGVAGPRGCGAGRRTRGARGRRGARYARRRSPDRSPAGCVSAAASSAAAAAAAAPPLPAGLPAQAAAHAAAAAAQVVLLLFIEASALSAAPWSIDSSGCAPRACASPVAGACAGAPPHLTASCRPAASAAPDHATAAPPTDEASITAHGGRGQRERRYCGLAGRRALGVTCGAARGVRKARGGPRAGGRSRRRRGGAAMAAAPLLAGSFHPWRACFFL